MVQTVVAADDLLVWPHGWPGWWTSYRLFALVLPNWKGQELLGRE